MSESLDMPAQRLDVCDVTKALVPGSYSWAEAEHNAGRPCARYDRRIGFHICHTSDLDSDYPNKAEDLAALDWEHLRERDWDPSSIRNEVKTFLRFGACRLILDSGFPGVVVPDYLQGKPELCLEIGYNMVKPIPDLELRAAGISATLSFHGEAFKCWIPWDAINHIVSAVNPAVASSWKHNR
jgi:hypothetical protein